MAKNPNCLKIQPHSHHSTWNLTQNPKQSFFPHFSLLCTCTRNWFKDPWNKKSVCKFLHHPATSRQYVIEEPVRNVGKWRKKGARGGRFLSAKNLKAPSLLQVKCRFLKFPSSSLSPSPPLSLLVILRNYSIHSAWILSSPQRSRERTGGTRPESAEFPTIAISEFPKNE